MTFPPPRSTTVSVVAWMGIMSGLGGTVGGLIMISAMPTVRGAGVLAGSVAGLVVSLGLSRRRNWARLSTIGALVLGPLNYLRILTLPTSPGVHRTWVALVPVLLINTALVAKLLSRNVRAEFGADE